MGKKITVQIDTALLKKMRDKAIADGLPNARTLPNEELLAALIQAELGVVQQPEEDEPAVTTPTLDKVWVTAGAGLNLRAQPVTGSVLRILAYQEELTVVKRQGDWIQVRTSDGTTGWVSTGLVSDQSPSVPPQPVTGAPSADTVWVSEAAGLNLRAQPVTGSVLRILADQEQLTVLNQQGGWIQVRTSDGTVGWVSREFVTDQNPSPTDVSVTTPTRRPDPGFAPAPGKGNVRGIHGSAGMLAPPQDRWNDWIHELKGMGMAWYKQLDAGDPNDFGKSSTFAWTKKLKQNGINPIIRYYQGQMFPGRLHDQAFEKMQLYAAEGIVFCEIGNEPNLDHAEWNSAHHGKLSFQNPFYPRTIVENWIKDAERAVAAGARPGFYAFAPTDWNGGQHPTLSSVMFYKRIFEHVAANPGLLDRFRRLFQPGKAWLSVHVSTYEFPVDFDPFPAGKPPHDMCLRGYEVPLRYMRDILDITDVVVMSTEGGVFCKDSTSMSGHIRLNSHQEHAQRTVEMFDWLQKNSPLHAMCPWLISNVYQAIGHSDPLWAHDGWFDGAGAGFNPKPVVQAMKNSKPTF